MDLTTILKAATVISTGCSVAIVAVGAYSLKQQSALNKTIADGTQEIAAGNKMMAEFINSIK